MSFWKRVKSYLITLTSIVGTAFTTIIFTPQWSDFTDWLTGTLHTWGTAHAIPTVVVILVGSLLGEVWKQILNMIMLSKVSYGAAREFEDNGIDLY